MQPVVFQERAKKFCAFSSWQVEALQTVWDSVMTAPPEIRDYLTPENCRTLLKCTQEMAEEFLVYGVLANLLQSRWQCFSPLSGWVLKESDSLAELKEEKIYDPVSQKIVIPDLETNIQLSFFTNPDLQVNSHNHYSGEWSDYVFHHFVKTYRQPESPKQPLEFKVLSAWELGKIEFNARAGESYFLVSLELGLVIPVSVTKNNFQPSIMNKMLALKSFQKNTANSIDLSFSFSGVSEENLLLSEGKNILWIKNKTNLFAAFILWKAPIFEYPQPLARFWNGRKVLNSQLMRTELISKTLPETYHIKLSSQAFLFASFDGLAEFLEKRGDFKSFPLIQNSLDHFRKIVESEKGFIFQSGSDSICATFPSALSAVRAAVTLRGTNSIGIPSWRIGIIGGSVLLTKINESLTFFGYAINLGKLLSDNTPSKALSLSMNIYTGVGVADFLYSRWYKCEQKALSLKAGGNPTVVYFCQELENSNEQTR